MIFNREFHPEIIASTDQTRPSLAFVQLDTAGSRLLATDGHRLIVLPCKPEDGDHTGPISGEAFKAARKCAKTVKRDMARIHANGALETGDHASPGPTFPRPTREATDFPPVNKVIPGDMAIGADGTVTVGLNARYVFELAKAMGCENVTLTIKSDGAIDPVVIRPTGNADSEGALAVLMPVRY